MSKCRVCDAGPAGQRLHKCPNSSYYVAGSDTGAEYPPPPDECPCGGYIAWLDEGDSWGGSCYGQCGDYPRVFKAARLT